MNEPEFARRAVVPFLLFPATVSLFCSLAHAQDTAAGASAVVEEIMVTARRRAETVQSVPVSISTFGEKDIEAQGISSGRDLGAITPGLAWKGDSPAGGSTVFIRGIGSNSDNYSASSAVAIYLDETYLNAQPLANVAAFDMERVEVLKGPQGTLYGRNTTGGAVKFVTRDPQPGEGASLQADVDVGNFDLLKGEGGMAFDITEKLAGRLAVSAQRRDGIYDNTADGQRFSDTEAHAARAKLLWKPTDKLSFKPSFNYSKVKSDGIPYKRVDYIDSTGVGRCADPRPGTAPGCTSFLQFFGANVDEPNHHAYDLQTELRNVTNESVEVSGSSLEINYRYPSALLTSVTSYFDVETFNLEDVDGSAQQLVLSHSLADIDQFTQEIRLTSEGDGPWNWVAGLYYFDEDSRSETLTSLFVADFGFANDYAQATESFSVFGEGSVEITDRLELSAGLRWTRDERTVDLVYGGFATASQPEVLGGLAYVRPAVALGRITPSFAISGQSNEWEKVSGRFVASYKLNPDAMIYASLSRGFKSGEFNSGAGNLASAAFVEPEVVDAYEAGLKSDLLDDRLRFNVAAFYYDYKDKQETFFNTGVAVLSNADAEVKGAEVELEARPLASLTLRAAFSFLDTEYTAFPSCLADGTDCTGNRLTASPERTAHLLARYDALVADRRLSLQLDGNYTSQLYFNFENANFNQQDSYWLANARGSYQLSDHLSAAAWVQNLFDEEYFVDGFNVVDLGYSLLVPGRPRMFGVTLGVSF